MILTMILITLSPPPHRCQPPPRPLFSSPWWLICRLFDRKLVVKLNIYVLLFSCQYIAQRPTWQFVCFFFIMVRWVHVQFITTPPPSWQGHASLPPSPSSSASGRSCLLPWTSSLWKAGLGQLITLTLFVIYLNDALPIIRLQWTCHPSFNNSLPIRSSKTNSI